MHSKPQYIYLENFVVRLIRKLAHLILPTHTRKAMPTAYPSPFHCLMVLVEILRLSLAGCSPQRPAHPTLFPRHPSRSYQLFSGIYGQLSLGLLCGHTSSRYNRNRRSQLEFILDSAWVKVHSTYTQQRIKSLWR